MSFLPLYLLLIGPFVGSFITATANTWPNWSGVLKVRSECSHCQQKIRTIDLLPVVGFLILGGKCRSCAAPIGVQHLISELMAISIAVAASFWFEDWMLLITVLFGWTLLFASLVDIRLKLLPDSATLGLVCAGFAVQFGQGGLDGLWLSVLGASLGFGLFYAIAKFYYLLRGRDGLGLGDAKLLAVGGAWLGPLSLSWIVLLAAGLALFWIIFMSMLGKVKPKADLVLSFGPALSLAIYVLWLLYTA